MFSSCGEIYSAYDKETGKKLVIKVIGFVEQNMSILVSEIFIMKECKHPSIVEYIDTFIVEERVWVRIFL